VGGHEAGAHVGWQRERARMLAGPGCASAATSAPDCRNPWSYEGKPAAEPRAVRGPSTAAGAAATVSPQPAATDSGQIPAGQELCYPLTIAAS
jgi:hypothetical protein